MTEFFRASSVRRNQGFTLIEMSIVLIISGLIMAIAMRAYTLYMTKQAYDETYSRIDTITDGINDFYSSYGRYPCPADPALPESDPKFGYEGDCTALKAAATPAWVGGIHKVAGARDTLADIDTNLDAVYIGAVPFKALKKAKEMFQVSVGSLQCRKVGLDPTLAANQVDCDANGDGVMDAGVYRPDSGADFDKADYKTMFDPYNYKFTYAITENLTNVSSFNAAYGAIKVKTESGTTLTSPDGAAHYVIVGHGPNHMGAYIASGNNVSKVAVACVAGTVDYENCNSDSTFTEGVITLGGGASYFDDVVKHSDYSLAQLWAFNGSNVYNVNLGNVGVGTSTPSQKLEVANSDTTDLTKGSIKASNAREGLICDQDNANCWDPDNFASSTGSTCSQTGVPAGSVRVMTGIKSANVACTTSYRPLPIVTPLQACASGTFAKGVSALGTLICGTP